MAFTNLLFFLFALFLTLGQLAPQAIAGPLDQEISLSMRRRHEQWMAKHGRVYKDMDEKEKRLRIFKENMERIDSFNANASNNKKTFTLGANDFSDMTHEEFLATHTGFKPSSSSKFDSNKHMASVYSLNNLTDAPDSVDWREKGAVTDVKDQNPCGCCWAFSSVAAVEGIYKIKTGYLVSFSEQQLLDCMGKTCESGGNMPEAFAYLNNNPLETEDNYQYNAQKGTCQAGSGGVVTITAYQNVPVHDTDALMSAVINQPVSIGIEGNSTEFMNYQQGVYNQGCGTDITHAVTLIGYGTDEGSGQNYWLIKNSWGPHWGEEGYMRLLMDENKCPITLDASYPTDISSQ